MKIEKLRCDGCLKEYDLNTDQLTIRILSKDEKSRVSLQTNSTEIKVPVAKSLDFCNLTCFQAYLDKFKEPTPPEPPE